MAHLHIHGCATAPPALPQEPLVACTAKFCTKTQMHPASAHNCSHCQAALCTTHIRPELHDPDCQRRQMGLLQQQQRQPVASASAAPPLPVPRRASTAAADARGSPAKAAAAATGAQAGPAPATSPACVPAPASRVPPPAAAPGVPPPGQAIVTALDGMRISESSSRWAAEPNAPSVEAAVNLLDGIDDPPAAAQPAAQTLAAVGAAECVDIGDRSAVGVGGLSVWRQSRGCILTQAAQACAPLLGIAAAVTWPAFPPPLNKG